MPSRSPKTVAASSNEIPCLRRFRAAFFGSHSNSTEKRLAASLVIGKLVASIRAALMFSPPSIRNGTKLVLESYRNEYPDAPRRDPKEFVDGSLIERLKQEKFVEGLKL